MHKVFLFLTILMSASCSLNHGRPIATLEYSSVKELRNTGLYQIYFTSDVELLQLFKSRIGEGLVCSLEDDLDFTEAHHIKRSGFGLVGKVIEPASLLYRANVIFSESESGKGGEDYLEGEALILLLKKRDFISCVFRVHTTTYNTYFSKVMHVPTAELLKAISKQ
ncbi:hypothetical protein [Pseudomonas sp. PMCC200344]|uniref:hypothetical protein n=1 Tax=Pseudomonas sp. PMCC200344 TaxID=3042028 RepID=UPI0024B36851|nr:hypothetical protein [Pseudomonas sp. PMCC200344]